MDVPVDFCALVEFGVDFWEEEGREGGGDDEEDCVVDEEGREDVVDVEGEG